MLKDKQLLFSGFECGYAKDVLCRFVRRENECVVVV